MFDPVAYLTDPNLTIPSAAFRLILAVIFGGIIGLERGVSGQPAGFRTHILVCVGAALAMMTNQYICQTFDGVHDPARLGAQVITGVGFLGVGTILVTGGHKIKGLTTAAGLWASACLGLALGIGFFTGAFIAAILIYISLALLPKLEAAIIKKSATLEYYIELGSVDDIKILMTYFREHGINVIDRTISKTPTVIEGCIALVLFIRVPRHTDRQAVTSQISDLEITRFLEEI